MLNDCVGGKLLELNRSCQRAEVYVFGSFLSKTTGIGDLDLVVVYEDSNDLKGLQSALNDMSKMIPLDVIYMHRDEERELNFIASRGAKEVGAVWPNKSLQVAPQTHLSSGVGCSSSGIEAVQSASNRRRSCIQSGLSR